MNYPLTKVLIKTLALGFYKVHTGLILTLFFLFFINFFYTSVLNQTHLTPDQIILNNLKLVLTSVSHPLATLLLFIIWLIYTAKSWQYITGQLKQEQYQFLYYTSTALSWRKQVESWGVVQLVISVPILVLGIFAIVIGLVFGHYVVPLLIPLYTVALLFGSAVYYTLLLNRLDEKADSLWLLRFVRIWPKPFFSLFLYSILSDRKTTYALTKLIAFLLIGFMYATFQGMQQDVRLVEQIILSIVLTHLVLICQSHEFELTYLRFGRNLPYNQRQLYGHLALQYVVLLLPELIWVFLMYPFWISLSVGLLGLSTALLFRTILYRLSGGMSRYLRVIFYLFVGEIVVTLFGGLWLLIFVNFASSCYLFYKYRSKALAS